MPELGVRSSHAIFVSNEMRRDPAFALIERQGYELEAIEDVVCRT